jgi:hypothetical protein
MEKKGTGWIPDYPDVNDYTLQSDAINNLAKRIQSQGGTNSIDNLAQKVYKALGILAEKHNDDDLKQIREDLNKEILGDLSFVTAEFRNVFKEGVADSEVLLIKNYLRHICTAPWQLISGLDGDYVKNPITDVITDVIFDSETRKQVQAVQKAITINSNQRQREADGCVDKYDLEILKLLAEISSVSNYEIKQLVQDMTRKWKKNKEAADAQINFAIYWQDIHDKLNIIYNNKNWKLTNGMVEAEDIDVLKEFAKDIPGFLNIKKAENDINNASILKEFIDRINKKHSTLELPETPFKELEKVLTTTDPFLTEEIARLDKLLKNFNESGDTKDLNDEAFYLQKEILRNYKNIMLQLYRIKIPQIPLEMFEEKIEPIASPINDAVSQLVKEKLLTKKISESKYLQLESELKVWLLNVKFNGRDPKSRMDYYTFIGEIYKIQQQIEKLISSITEVIVQMLMPLGQHSNLSERVDREIAKAQYLVDPEKDIQEESKKLIREIFDAYKFSPVISLDTGDNFDFKAVIFKTIEKFENDLEINNAKLLRVFQQLGGKEKQIEDINGDDSLSKIIQENFSTESKYFINAIKLEVIQLINTPLYSIIKGYLKLNSSEPNNEKTSAQIKKPIFEISLSELEMYESDSSSSSDNMRSQQMRNRLVFPINRSTLLAQVKVLLASEIPCIFGFTLYKSVYDEFNVQRGHIPLPHQRDNVIGGHTVVAVGYHDRKVIENADGKRSEGALLIRNSWGTRWGQGGYGWLPYDYIIQGLTADWWSLLKADWLATGRFGAGASAWNPDKGGEKGVREGQSGS